MSEERERRLFAIERVQERKYALCRLGDWVKQKDILGLGQDGVECEPQRKRQALQSLNNGQPWWVAATAEGQQDALPVSEVPLPKLNMLAAASPLVTAARTTTNQGNGAADESQLDQDMAIQPPTGQDALEDFAKHYLEALYLSRVPVGYFAKGPIARVRAAFSSEPHELIQFLRGAILPSSVTDKKYRESIAELIKELPPFENPETKPKSKRKRKWRPKRDKSGFFVDEKDHVEQWWRKGDDDVDSGDAVEKLDAVIKRRSQRLRNRETFLQVLLVLEVMALEAATPPTAPSMLNAAETQNTETETQHTHAATEEKKPRKKKELDVTAILETLLDRLCIWYSLESSTPAKTSAGSNDVKDDLKTFASEVVIPFYGSRIPDQADAASKKLGGPTAPTPAKEKSSMISRKPGVPANRQPPERKPRKPFSRVSTDTMNRFNRPSLHRAATDSEALAPLIKREMSETPPIDSVPKWRRGGHQQASGQPGKRISQLEKVTNGTRQIDFAAMSQANEARMRRKADVDEKLREAITTLKKPNRDRAVEEMAKNTDQSFAKAIAKSSKSTSQTHQPRKAAQKSSVAVTATPRHVKATPAPRRRLDQNFEQRSSATSIVPSSSAKLLAQLGGDTIPGSTFAVPQSVQRPRHAAAIDDTPSRGFAKFMPPALTHQPGTLEFESPTLSRTAAIAGTPARPIAMPSLTAAKGAIETRPEAVDDSGIGVEGDSAPRGSIYDAWGWNDEDYEELA